MCPLSSVVAAAAATCTHQIETVGVTVHKDPPPHPPQTSVEFCVSKKPNRHHQGNPTGLLSNFICRALTMENRDHGGNRGVLA